MKRFFKRHRAPVDHKLSALVPASVGSPPEELDHFRPIDSQPVRTSSPSVPLSCPAWHTPEEHAVALLQWMQGPGGRVGEVPASELMKVHAELCSEYFWEPAPWIPVAKALRRLLNEPKHRYASRHSRRVVVYLIPPAVAREP